MLENVVFLTKVCECVVELKRKDEFEDGCVSCKGGKVIRVGSEEGWCYPIDGRSIVFIVSICVSVRLAMAHRGLQLRNVDGKLWVTSIPLQSQTQTPFIPLFWGLCHHSLPHTISQLSTIFPSSAGVFLVFLFARCVACHLCISS